MTLLTTSQGMQVATGGWKKQGNKFCPRTSRKNAVLPTHIGLFCQTWGEGSLLKFRALRPDVHFLGHTYLLIWALLPSKALSQNWIQVIFLWDPYNPCPRSLFSLRGSCHPFSSLLCQPWRPSKQILRGQHELFLSLSCIV